MTSTTFRRHAIPSLVARADKAGSTTVAARDAFGLRMDIEGLYLKCDAPGCSHVEAVPELSASYIGRACPLCGANLLTEQDHAAMVALERTLQTINDAFPIPPDAETVNGPHVDINPHAGALHITVKEGE